MEERSFAPRKLDGALDYETLKRLIVAASRELPTMQVLDLADALHEQMRERRQRRYERDVAAAERASDVADDDRRQSRSTVGNFPPAG